jgi:hypothetical protein
LSANRILQKQIDQLIDSLEAYNKKLPHPRESKNYIYLRQFFKNFIRDNNNRATEVESDEYKKVRKFADSLLPVKIFWNLCIDGRVRSVLLHGASAGVGSSIKEPGGIIREFVRGSDGQLTLKEDSDFAHYLDRAYTMNNLDAVSEVFDSHLGCAARLQEERLKGREPGDSGLYADVSHKLQMAQATGRYVAQRFGNDKRIHLIQTSFDPQSGFMYMGLELKNAHDVASKNGKSFTEAVLMSLVKDNKIIFTGDMVQDEKIKQLFEKHLFTPDWKSNYVYTANEFWKAIAALWEPLHPIFAKKVKSVFPDFEERKKDTQEALDTRIFLLMTNAFSGFIHNKIPSVHYDSAGPHNEPMAGSVHTYPYGVHDEQGIRVSEGGYAPYKISMFTVFSHSEASLPANIELAATLVRNNRREGRVHDQSGIFNDAQEFAEASLPMIVQEIVRDDITDEEWKALAAIDWSDLPSNWEAITDDEFFDYLKTKEMNRFDVGIGINNLRKRMALLYYPYYAISSRLIEHYTVPLPVVADTYKRNWLVMPFVKLGFA